MINAGQIVFNPSVGHRVRGITMPDPEAQTEAIKDVTKEEIKSKQKLDGLVSTAQQRLFKTSTVFPFTLFPDDIIIDTNKVTVDYWEFFLSHHIRTVLIKDISEIIVETGLFFATIKIIDRDYAQNEVVVKYLWKKQAQRVGKIIKGLMVGVKEAIDFSSFSSQELLQKIEELGDVKK